MEISKVGNNVFNNTQINELKLKAEGDRFEKQLKTAMEQKDDKELKKVCKEFESIMLTLMYKQMRATVPQSELIPDSQGKEIFESMLDDELMKEAAKSNGIGLGGILYKQLSKHLKSAVSADSAEGSKKIVEK